VEPAGSLFSFSANEDLGPPITAYAARVPAAIHPRVPQNIARPALFFLPGILFRVIGLILSPQTNYFRAQ
jgi:hypothetical protein